MRTLPRFLVTLFKLPSGLPAGVSFWFRPRVLAQAPRVEHVVIVGVDGMSPDGVQKAKAPTWRG